MQLFSLFVFSLTSIILFPFKVTGLLCLSYWLRLTCNHLAVILRSNYMTTRNSWMNRFQNHIQSKRPWSSLLNCPEKHGLEFMKFDLWPKPQAHCWDQSSTTSMQGNWQMGRIKKPKDTEMMIRYWHKDRWDKSNTHSEKEGTRKSFTQRDMRTPSTYWEKRW